MIKYDSKVEASVASDGEGVCLVQAQSRAHTSRNEQHICLPG